MKRRALLGLTGFLMGVEPLDQSRKFHFDSTNPISLSTEQCLYLSIERPEVLESGSRYSSLSGVPSSLWKEVDPAYPLVYIETPFWELDPSSFLLHLPNLEDLNKESVEKKVTLNGKGYNVSSGKLYLEGSLKFRKWVVTDSESNVSVELGLQRTFSEDVGMPSQTEFNVRYETILSPDGEIRFSDSSVSSDRYFSVAKKIVDSVAKKIQSDCKSTSILNYSKQAFRSFQRGSYGSISLVSGEFSADAKDIESLLVGGEKVTVSYDSGDVLHLRRETVGEKEVFIVEYDHAEDSLKMTFERLIQPHFQALEYENGQLTATFENGQGFNSQDFDSVPRILAGEMSKILAYVALRNIENRIKP